MRIKLIVIITISTIVLFGMASLYGRYQWQLETDRLHAQLTNGRQTINPKTYDSKELEGLPTPVQRFSCCIEGGSTDRHGGQSRSAGTNKYE